MHTTADIPEVEPTEITAGDTVKWYKTLDHYSAADGWELTYNLRGPSAINITATQDGSTARHAVSVAAGTTDDWVPGDYVWKAFATSSALSERYEVGSGKITIHKNWALLADSQEIRSDAQIILDALVALQKDRATRPEVGYSIQAAGRSFNFKSDMDIIKAIQYWESVVARESSAPPQIVRMKFTL